MGTHSDVVTTLLLLLTLTAALLDWYTRHIPNWLTAAGLAAALATHAAFRGWGGLGFALAGFAVGGGVYLVLFVLRAMGGGDVKLMAAVGAFCGLRTWFMVFFFASLLGAAAALAFLLWRGALKRTIHNVAFILKRLHCGRAPYEGRPDLDVTTGRGLSLPHGVAIGIATWLVLVLHRSGAPGLFP